MSCLSVVVLLALFGCPPIPNEEPGTVVGRPDKDEDGFDRASDCDDSNALISPAAAEMCNGIDDNCDGVIDEDAVDIITWYADADGDDYGDAAAYKTECTAPARYVKDASDCNDASDDYYPGAPETGCTGPDYNCDGDEGDGLRVPADYDSIQDAIDDSASGDHVCVAAGTYYEDIDFGGKSLSVEGVDGSGSTFIQGTGNGSVVTLLDAVQNIRLAGFTITGGENDSGAGVYAPNVGGEFEDLVISGNGCTTASSCYGVGMYAYGSLRVVDVTVRDNYASPEVISSGSTAAVAGAGAYFLDGVSINGLTVEDNYVDTSNVASDAYLTVYGAGVIFAEVSRAVEDLVVTGNYVDDGSGSSATVVVYGAGVAMMYGSGTYDRVKIQKNYTSGKGSSVYVYGGAMWSYGDSSTIDHLDVRANTADAIVVYGAGVHFAGYDLKLGMPVITNAIIAGNQALWSNSEYNYAYGGGMYFSSYTYPYLTNVDVYGNKLSAEYGDGGGMYFDYYYTGVYGNNVAVCSNSAKGGGGAVYVYPSTYSYGQNFFYSDFYGNSSPEFSGISTVVGSNDNIEVTPGYTSVSGADSTTWDFALTAGSGLTNTGDVGIQDADGSRSDIGAYGGPGGAGW